MDDDGGGGGGGTIRLVCENCNREELYSLEEDGDEGSFWCSQCDMEHRSTQPPPAVDHDFQGKRPLYRLPKPKPPKHLIPNRTQRAPAAPAFDEADEPRDFVPGTADASWGGEPEELGTRVRQRYVRGLQVILQQQLEALVERHRVGALVCGVAGPLWLRWVAASKVFEEMWARKVLADDATAHGLKRYSTTEGNALVQLLPVKDQQRKPQQVKREWADEALPPRKDRRKVEFIFLRSLRKMLPVYSTLSVCFLACHVAREAILPTNIYTWAMEGKLPYVAAFTQVDNLLGTPQKHCPLSARQLFRPVRVIGAWQLEAAAGSIARRIGLRLPSVNFYAIAQRYLSELSLPIQRILPHACRIYEWAMPAQLWLSSNPARVPTRVCVMAILIVALRIQYNINGQGIWEEISEAGRNAGGSGPDANLPLSMKPDGGTSEEFGTRELLCTLADAYEKIDAAHDYSKDLHSYLKYCENVVFPGIRCSLEDNDLIKIFQDMYKGREDKNPKVQTEEIRATDGANKRVWDGTSVGARCFHASSSGIQSIKSEMEDHGFRYMPPRKRPRSEGYLHYRRKTIAGSLACVGHADYYMLIRSFAKLAEVDVRIMHASVLKLERRLAWIEERMGRSLDVLNHLLPSLADGTNMT